MKKLSALGLSVALLAFGGCATTQQQVTNIENQVIAGCKTACNFIPEAETVTNLYFSGNPIYATTELIVAAICNEVENLPPATASALMKGEMSPLVINGVAIHGVFTAGPNVGKRL